MARRGEGQFVAIEVNLRGDPVKVGRLTRMLRVTRNEAVGMIAAWRELVLTRGQGLSGVLKGYPAEDIADFLDWRGKGKPASKLVAALAAAEELTSRRGIYRHPYWADTPTGWYAAKKAFDRDRKKGGRGRDGGPEGDGGGGGSADIPRNGHGTSAEVPSRSGQEVSKDPSGGAPPGGESEASPPAELAEWFVATHPKLRNPKKCRRLIAAMGAEDRAQLAYCLPLHAPLYGEKKQKKAWRFVPFADSYLEDGTYWEHRPPKPKVEKKPDGEAEAKALAEQLDQAAKHERSRQMLQQRAIVVEQLRSEGITVRRGSQEFEDLVDQRMQAGDGRPS